MQLTSPNPNLFFKGRPGDPRLGEKVKLASSSKNSQPSADFKAILKSDVVLFGCPDDLGVRNNRGRAGAAEGPDAIRSNLYRMTPPLSYDLQKNFQIWDCGNIAIGKDLIETHLNARVAARGFSLLGSKFIVLGGGHDFAAPNFLGWAEGISASSKKKPTFGLINIDPHLDVRELENGQPHSGTPFRQILDSKMLEGRNFIEFGAREGRNAATHFQYCKKNAVKVLEFDKLKSGGNVTKEFAKHLASLSKTTTHIGLTIDMDSCNELEGVSAAPVLGFSAWELCQFAFIGGKSSKIGYLEIAEVAPGLDPSGRSARIGAEVIFYFLKGLLSKSKGS